MFNGVDRFLACFQQVTKIRADVCCFEVTQQVALVMNVPVRLRHSAMVQLFLFLWCFTQGLVHSRCGVRACPGALHVKIELARGCARAMNYSNLCLRKGKSQRQEKCFQDEVCANAH
jgi:hypothetical protein